MDWSSEAVAALGLTDTSDVHLLGQGQLCTAVLVGPDLVVRFPRHSLGVEHLLRERKMVALVTDKVAVALPLPAAANLDSPRARSFAAHQLVAGEVVDPLFLASVGVEELEDFVGQLSRFLQDLSFATDDAIVTGIQVATLTELANHLRDEVRALLAPYFSESAALRAAGELDALAGADSGRLALCHGDLGGGLVWHRDARHLGVIDWGAAIVSDPVLDLASLASLSPQLAEVVGERVDHLRDRGEDATAVRSTFVLQEMLYAARQQDWQLVVGLLRDY